MSKKNENPSSPHDDRTRISVCKNGPYLVSGGIPLQIKEIRNDSEGYCSTWLELTTFPLQEQYSLCRCGQSKSKPFCDGTHLKIHFDGTETADDAPYLGRADSSKKHEIVHPGVLLCGTKRAARHLNPNSKNPLWSLNTPLGLNTVLSGFVGVFRLNLLIVMFMKSGTGRHSVVVENHIISHFVTAAISKGDYQVSETCRWSHLSHFTKFFCYQKFVKKELNL
jgi:CDGSH-type Zn-finger protein